MVAVLHIVPIQPVNRVQLDAHIPFVADDGASHALYRVNGAAVSVLVQIQEHRAFIVYEPVHVAVVLVGVGLYRVVYNVLHRAVVACVFLYRVQHFTPGYDYVWLGLHPPVIRISKIHTGIFYDLCFYAVLIIVPERIQTAVAIYGGIAHKLPYQGRYLVPLKQRNKFVVHNGGYLLHALVVRRRRKR